MPEPLTFEDYKNRKLKRLWGLRVMHYLGMVSWVEDRYGDAKQLLRLIHPLSWVWLLSLTLVSVFGQGVPDTIKDLRSTIKLETVWW